MTFPVGDQLGLSSATPIKQTKQKQKDDSFMHCPCSHPQETGKGEKKKIGSGGVCL